MAIEQTIITNVLNNEEYFGSVAAHIKQEYFADLPFKSVLDLIYTFYYEYNAVPSYEALRIMTDKTITSDENLYDECQSIITIAESEEPQENVKWLVNETEVFCQQQALFNALSESLVIKNNSELPLKERNVKIPDVGILPDLMRDALAVTFDSSVGHDYFDDADARHERYNTVNSKYSFGPGLENLDTLTGGGVEDGTLNLIMAPVNTGKSLGLCALASQYMLQGYNVLYISMEMDEHSVSKRVDANLLDISMDDLKSVSKRVFGGKLDKLKNKCTGSLKTKQYPTSNASVIDFAALLNELNVKQNWKPNIILVDYLGITKSKRIMSAENTYAYQKVVSEELRGFAIEHNLPLWSAVQTNRDAWGASDISMANIADSAAVAATADLMLGIIETEELIAAMQQLLKPVKNRYGSKDVEVLSIVVDKDKQRWTANSKELQRKGVPINDIPTTTGTGSQKMIDMSPDDDSNIEWDL